MGNNNIGRHDKSVGYVPSSLVQQQDGNGTAVWVLDPASMTVQLQRVQVSTADGNSAVIAAGLVPGHARRAARVCS